VLTDLHMPEMDGYALTSALRVAESSQCHIPIIALTANALRDEELVCLAAGMDAYLTKPIRLAKLQEAIEAWIGPALQATMGLPEKHATDVSDLPADLGVLAAMVGNDPSVINEMLQEFRLSASAASKKLQRSADSGSLRAAAEATQCLKSSARAIDALELGDLCDAIEQAALANDTVKVAAQLSRFQNVLDRLMRLLNSRLLVVRQAQAHDTSSVWRTNRRPGGYRTATTLDHSLGNLTSAACAR
jgi:response regulator RpfG family c-di-GMP phosphodiesterase